MGLPSDRLNQLDPLPAYSEDGECMQDKNDICRSLTENGRTNIIHHSKVFATS
jgi:hypothetical protein